MRGVPEWARELMRDPHTLACLEWSDDEIISESGERYPIRQGIPVFHNYVDSYQNRPEAAWPQVTRRNPTVKAFEDRETVFDRFAERLKGEVIVDMCSGGGMPSYYLAARYGCRVISVERAWNVLKQYGDRFQAYYGASDDQVVRVCADALRLPLCDEAVAAVVGSSWVHHFVDKTAVLRSAYRVLAPGGLLLAHNEGIKGLLTRKGSEGEDIHVSTKVYRLAAQDVGFSNVRVIGSSRFFLLLGILRLRGSVDIVGQKPRSSQSETPIERCLQGEQR